MERRFNLPKFQPRFLIPDFDGAFLSPEWRDALWARFYTGAPRRQKRSVGAIQHSQESLRGLAKRSGISRLPQIEGEKTAKTKSRSYPIGCFHFDLAEVSTAEGKHYMFVAIDRTSKFALVELHRKADRYTAGDFLHHLADAVAYKINIILTDNSTHSTTLGVGGAS